MNIPDAAIGEAAAAIQFIDRSNLTRTARAALEAAMPAIREGIAQEIEDYVDASTVRAVYVREIVRVVVRGGTP